MHVTIIVYVVKRKKSLIVFSAAAALITVGVEKVQFHLGALSSAVTRSATVLSLPYGIPVPISRLIEGTLS